jgi:NADPH:quinone reductase-like Zn-dependent oxidoreductase
VYLCFCDFRTIPTLVGQQSIMQQPNRDHENNSTTIPRGINITNTTKNGRTQPHVLKPLDPPHLIVGCCFADLLHPVDLTSSLIRCFFIPLPVVPSHSYTTQTNRTERSTLSILNDDCASKSSNALRHTHSLLYFPITFTGITTVYPSQPFATTTTMVETASRDSNENSTVHDTDTAANSGQQMPPAVQYIPSDTLAFNYYAAALSDVHHHHLNVDDLVSTVQDYGGTCLQKGTSDWIIDPNLHPYLWETMLYFFGTTAAPQLQADGWYARGWIHRLRHYRPSIRASNLDLLFRIPHLGRWTFDQAISRYDDNSCDSTAAAALSDSRYQEILFTGPRQVSCIEKETVSELLPNQIRIQSEYSLISSGTELKIFQGNFDHDAILDTTLQDFQKERMTYPLSYGYSLVGRVIECGSDVVDASYILGRRVFTFSPHASQVLTDRVNVHIVPEDVDAIDAIFMPSVETALSLVQEARPMIGENVAVYGQGMIGLLITALLRNDEVVRSSFGRFGTISTFDTMPDRLAVSASMGASQALLPSEAKLAGPFDVVIEVSGNCNALQMAIDSTRDGGRIIVGSWYGRDDVKLKLGVDFHRSHKAIKASQVSEIPAELSKTWSKERRFALTWALLKSIRPSQLITLRTKLNNTQAAYSALENGTELAVVFEYTQIYSGGFSEKVKLEDD